MYIVSEARQIVALYNTKASRTLSTRQVVTLAMQNLYGTPHHVIPYYAADDSGINPTPLPGSQVKPEHRINYLQTKAAHRYLSGSGLVRMIELYLKVLKRRIGASQIGSDWVDHPDLYTFLQNEVFRSSVEAMCGPHLLAQSTSFVEDFWAFMSSVPTLFKGLPKWTCPKGHGARGRLLHAIKNWHKIAHEQSDCTKTDMTNPEWEMYYGSELIRSRQEYGRGIDFMDADALAAEDLGLLFAYDSKS